MNARQELLTALNHPVIRKNAKFLPQRRKVMAAPGLPFVIAVAMLAVSLWS